MNNLKPSKSELIKLLEYFNSERYKEAEILALSITEKFPNHPFGWKILGSILRKEGKLSEALFFNKKAVKLDPEDANAHNNLGNNLNDLSRLVEAEESYRQAIILNPNFAEAYNNLGNTLNSLQKPADAEENFKQAIILRPGFSESRYSLGLLSYEAADYEKAIEYFKGSDFKKSQHYLLKCFFRQDNKSFFYDQLDHLIEKSEIDPMIGSLVCRSQLRYGLERPNLFCKYPLNYVLKKDLNSAAFFNLPNRVFFESANIFLNNSGNYKKTVKIVPSTNNSKENWHLIRKILSSLSNLNLNSNHNNVNKLIYKINNHNNFIKFTGLHYYPISYMTLQNKYYKEFKCFRTIISGYQSKKKYYKSKFFLWLEDFYIGGKDNYSIFSSVMINCSKYLRIESTNFKYVI